MEMSSNEKILKWLAGNSCSSDTIPDADLEALLRRPAPTYNESSARMLANPCYFTNVCTPDSLLNIDFKSWDQSQPLDIQNGHCHENQNDNVVFLENDFSQWEKVCCKTKTQQNFSSNKQTESAFACTFSESHSSSLLHNKSCLDAVIQAGASSVDGFQGENVPFLEATALECKAASSSGHQLGLQEVSLESFGASSSAARCADGTPDNKNMCSESVPSVYSSDQLNFKSFFEKQLKTGNSTSTANSSVEQKNCESTPKSSMSNEGSTDNKQGVQNNSGNKHVELIEILDSDDSCNAAIGKKADDIPEITIVDDEVCSNWPPSRSKERVMPLLIPLSDTSNQDENNIESGAHNPEAESCEVMDAASSPEMPKLIPFTSETEEPPKSRERSDKSRSRSSVSLDFGASSMQPRVVLKRIQIPNGTLPQRVRIREDCDPSCITLDSDEECQPIPGIPEVDVIDDLNFYSFCSRREMDAFCHKYSNNLSFSAIDINSTCSSCHDHDIRTFPTKTNDVTQIKGWRTKHFEGCPAAAVSAEEKQETEGTGIEAAADTEEVEKDEKTNSGNKETIKLSSKDGVSEDVNPSSTVGVKSATCELAEQDYVQNQPVAAVASMDSGEIAVEKPKRKNEDIEVVKTVQNVEQDKPETKEEMANGEQKVKTSKEETKAVIVSGDEKTQINEQKTRPAKASPEKEKSAEVQQEEIELKSENAKKFEYKRRGSRMGQKEREPKVKEGRRDELEPKDEKLKKKAKSGELDTGIYVSESLEHFLKESAQLKVPYLEETNPNIIPIPSDSSILSLGNLRKDDKYDTEVRTALKRPSLGSRLSESVAVSKKDENHRVKEDVKHWRTVYHGGGGGDGEDNKDEDFIPKYKIRKKSAMVVASNKVLKKTRQWKNKSEAPGQRLVLRLRKDNGGVSDGYKVTEITTGILESNILHRSPKEKHVAKAVTLDKGMKEKLHLKTDESKTKSPINLIKETLFSDNNKKSEIKLLNEFLRKLNLYGTRNDVTVLVKSNQVYFETPSVTLQQFNLCMAAISTEEQLLKGDVKPKKKSTSPRDSSAPSSKRVKLSGSPKAAKETSAADYSSASNANASAIEIVYPSRRANPEPRSKRSIRLPARLRDSAILADGFEWVNPVVMPDTTPSSKRVRKQVPKGPDETQTGQSSNSPKSTCVQSSPSKLKELLTSDMTIDSSDSESSEACTTSLISFTSEISSDGNIESSPVAYQPRTDALTCPVDRGPEIEASNAIYRTTSGKTETVSAGLTGKVPLSSACSSCKGSSRTVCYDSMLKKFFCRCASKSVESRLRQEVQKTPNFVSQLGLHNYAVSSKHGCNITYAACADDGKKALESSQEGGLPQSIVDSSNQGVQKLERQAPATIGGTCGSSVNTAVVSSNKYMFLVPTNASNMQAAASPAVAGSNIDVSSAPHATQSSSQVLSFLNLPVKSGVKGPVFLKKPLASNSVGNIGPCNKPVYTAVNVVSPGAKRNAVSCSVMDQKFESAIQNTSGVKQVVLAVSPEKNKNPEKVPAHLQTSACKLQASASPVKLEPVPAGNPASDLSSTSLELPLKMPSSSVSFMSLKNYNLSPNRDKLLSSGNSGNDVNKMSLSPPQQRMKAVRVSSALVFCPTPVSCVSSNSSSSRNLLTVAVSKERTLPCLLPKASGPTCVSVSSMKATVGSAGAPSSSPLSATAEPRLAKEAPRHMNGQYQVGCGVSNGFSEKDAAGQTSSTLGSIQVADIKANYSDCGEPLSSLEENDEAFVDIETVDEFSDSLSKQLREGSCKTEVMSASESRSLSPLTVVSLSSDSDSDSDDDDSSDEHCEGGGGYNEYAVAKQSVVVAHGFLRKEEKKTKERKRRMEIQQAAELLRQTYDFDENLYAGKDSMVDTLKAAKKTVKNLSGQDRALMSCVQCLLRHRLCLLKKYKLQLRVLTEDERKAEVSKTISRLKVAVRLRDSRMPASSMIACIPQPNPMLIREILKNEAALHEFKKILAGMTRRSEKLLNSGKNSQFNVLCDMDTVEKMKTNLKMKIGQISPNSHARLDNQCKNEDVEPLDNISDNSMDLRAHLTNSSPRSSEMKMNISSLFVEDQAVAKESRSEQHTPEKMLASVPSEECPAFPGVVPIAEETSFSTDQSSPCSARSPVPRPKTLLPLTSTPCNSSTSEKNSDLLAKVWNRSALKDRLPQNVGSAQASSSAPSIPSSLMLPGRMVSHNPFVHWTVANLSREKGGEEHKVKQRLISPGMYQRMRMCRAREKLESAKVSDVPGDTPSTVASDNPKRTETSVTFTVGEAASFSTINRGAVLTVPPPQVVRNGRPNVSNLLCQKIKSVDGTVPSDCVFPQADAQETCALPEEIAVLPQSKVSPPETSVHKEVGVVVCMPQAGGVDSSVKIAVSRAVT